MTDPRTSPARVLGVDLARGLALVSMFVAHTAPSAGPGGVLQLSEFLTFPLFALLVGVGAELGARRHPPRLQAVRALVHAVALLGIGWLLQQAGAQIIIVLPVLGVLTLLAFVLSRLSSPAVAALGLLSAAAAPWTLSASRGIVGDLWVSQSPWSWWLALLVDLAYPQAVLFSLGALGVLVTRWVLPASGEERPRREVLLACGPLLLAGTLLLLDATGRIDLLAYRTEIPEQVFVACLAAGVLGVSLLLARPTAALWRSAVGVVAASGAMTTTLYSLHVLWLAFWVRELSADGRDDTWVNVLGMTLAAWLLAWLWRALPLRGVWSRGPVEGLVGLAAVGLERLLPGVASSRATRAPVSLDV